MRGAGEWPDADGLPLLGGRWLAGGGLCSCGLEVGEKSGKDADGREKRAHVIDEVEVGQIRQLAQKGRADAAQAKRKSEEKTGNCSHSAGDQFLGVDQNRGKR